MLGGTGNCARGAWRDTREDARGAWRALLPHRMNILPGRTALETWIQWHFALKHCLPPSFEELVEL